MKLVVISPEDSDPREPAVLAALFAAGLERYHVRKPAWSHARLESWLHELPERWRSRVVLHQHHELVDACGLGGRHWRDDGNAGVPPASLQIAGPGPALPGITSRSCHDLLALRRSLGLYASVFMGPIFASVSKAGYGPGDAAALHEVSALLGSRTAGERRTTVLALGGITPERVGEAHALGFDGVAVLGAIWGAADPVRAFGDFQEALCCHAA